MTAFEYVIVLISIILGLGITQIMMGLADLVHQWNKVKFYWPHLIWIMLVFVLHIQDWWDTYNLRGFEPWRLPTFLFFSLYPVNLFVLARILFPFQPTEGTIDLREFYFQNFRKFFISTMLLNLLSIAENIMVRGIEYTLLVPAGLFLLLGWFVIRPVDSERHHKLLTLLLLALLIFSVVLNWNTWLID
ncbi:MAG TPA: hypothetical protein PK059_02805 [Cyclobacteriaceae bacterium]|jgi:hypothetical protein|nr:hypothetical protein [Cyclobacteriaceae bacterium]